MVHSYIKEIDPPAQYLGRMKRCVIFAVFGGFICYFLFYFIDLAFYLEFIHILALRIADILPFLSLGPFHSWSGIIFCMLLCMGFALAFRSRVRIFGDELRVSGGGKTTRIALKDFDHTEARNIQFSLWLIPVSIWKCRLYYREGDRLCRRRLYGFDAELLNSLDNRIRIQDTEQMAVEKKAAIAGSVNSGSPGEPSLAGTEYALDHVSLFAREASSLRQALIIQALLASAVLLLLLLNHMLSAMMFFELAGLSAILIIDIPVKIARFQKRKKICPSHITVSSSGLIVDNKYFPYSMVNTIRLMTKKASPILPAQYFMAIQADDGEKYWLGSDASCPEYPDICLALKKAMIFCPDKLEEVSRGF